MIKNDVFYEECNLIIDFVTNERLDLFEDKSITELSISIPFSDWIRNEFNQYSPDVRGYIFGILELLAFDNIVNKVKNTNLIYAFNSLWACYGGNDNEARIELPTKQKWHEWIIQANKYDRYFPREMLENGEVDAIDSKTRVYCLAVLWLIENKLPITIQKRKIHIDETSHKAIWKRIGDLVNEIGGLPVINVIFSNIKNVFAEEHLRYNVSRSGSIGTRLFRPQIPFGFLLQLALKYIRLENINVTKEALEYLLQLSQHYSTLYQVQQANQYEIMFSDPKDIIKNSRDLRLYDTLFAFMQLNSNYCMYILDNILSEWFHEAIFDDIKIKHYIKVVKTIIGMCVNWHKPLIFTAQDIHVASGRQISARMANTVMNVLLSIDCASVNCDLVSPEDNLEKSIYNYPLSKVSDRFIFVNASLCCYGFIQNSINFMREHCNNKNIYFDRHIGFCVETMIAKKLSSIGLSVMRGKYQYECSEWDCDLIVEGSDTIAFFEVKKRTLSFDSLSGKPIDILFDLSKSLIQSTRQALKHEIRLRKTGVFSVRDQNIAHEIQLNDRRVLLVSVSLLDFGSLSYHPSSQKILQSYYHHGFQFSDDATDDEKMKYAKKLDEINIEGDKLRDAYTELLSIDNYYKKSPPFSHCLFLSVPQIFTLAENCRNNDDFLRSISLSRSIVSSNMDFYNDYDNYVKNFNNRR